MREVEKYSDESDRATALEEAALDVAVSSIRNKANVLEFEVTGYCLNCEEKLEDNKRFCDQNCAEDFLLRQGKKGHE